MKTQRAINYIKHTLEHDIEPTPTFPYIYTLDVFIHNI